MKNMWDPNVKINFSILNEGGAVKLALTPVGVSLEVGVMCPMKKTLGTCRYR